jgi:chromatin remodeling complex protein RSC6
MKKKMFALLCACAVTVGLIAGCGGSSSTASTSTSGGSAEGSAAETQTSTSETEGVRRPRQDKPHGHRPTVMMPLHIKKRKKSGRNVAFSKKLTIFVGLYHANP